MQAYKVKGKIDETGHLIIAESIELAPGDVEVIVLQLPPRIETVPDSDQPEDSSAQKHGSLIKAFQGLFENAPPVPPDSDPDQAKWEYLKEKPPQLALTLNPSLKGRGTLPLMPFALGRSDYLDSQANHAG